MKNMHVGVRVARQVRTAEHAVDQAMIEVCRLVQTALEGRVEARLAAEVGQDALANMVRGLSQLAEVRGAVIASHGELAQVADEHHVGWYMDGPREDKTGPGTTVPPFAIAA
ncbi:hypothetical protein [Brevundimonas sp.]|uniref:hypothetical protein n=1 Tax=Brevundimonas sp. TaxID=1871086 RepID=UPI003D0A1E0F